MTISALDSPRKRGVLTRGRSCGGLRAMEKGSEEVQRSVVAIVTRLFAQNGRSPPSSEEMASFAARLATLVEEHGLPRPLAEGEPGSPGSLPEVECVPLVTRVLGGSTDPLLADAARQLVKACFHPEFTVCRESFREVARDGVCRRQELARVRGRVSGAHCVDCPYWVALSPELHERFLAGEWRAGASEFARHRDVFLPEDFRALRRWLHAASRGDSDSSAAMLRGSR